MIYVIVVVVEIANSPISVTSVPVGVSLSQEQRRGWGNEAGDFPYKLCRTDELGQYSKALS
jgi:hypothetical protein